MRDVTRRRIAGATATVAVAMLTACGGSAAPAPAGTSGGVRTSQGYDLYTHCGIDEARIGGHYYQAVHPLGVVQGNPPAGWGNPYQHGTMTLISDTEAVFTDAAGHRVVFRLRPGATTFLRICS